MDSQVDDGDRGTHGFHAYPARMHPALAASLLEAFSPGPGATVLDPFCGSGTVAVEAMRLGWRSLNSDLDPIALRLARVKTELRGRKRRDAFMRSVDRVARASERRVRDRVAVRARLGPEERSWYDIHVLKEMAGLLEEIRRVEDKADRRAMEMVFSALVIKFSRQRSETSRKQIDKKLRKGLVTEFFARKSTELCERWASLRAEVPDGAHEPRFVRSDARVLPNTLGGEFQCDLVLSSPPYGGTYDYAEHHARRHAWLDMKTGDFRAAEIGARRNMGRPGREPSSGNRKKGPSARTRWDEELLAVLVSMESLMHSSGLLVFVIGDGELDGKIVAADQQIETLAPRAGLEFLAAAKQPRGGGDGEAARFEHVVALMRP
jgi:16S rRNA G966 N2-methylase RsmD